MGNTQSAAGVLSHEQVCAAMTFEEDMAERAAEPPDGCALRCYCLRMCAGLYCELPLRCCYHCCCAGLSSVVCAPCFCCCATDPPDALLRHHHAMLRAYGRLVSFLHANVTQSDEPWYVYRPPRVRLTRPAPPAAAPSGTLTAALAADALACPVAPASTEPRRGLAALRAFCSRPCEPLDFTGRLFNRRVASLLCVLSGPRSCHAAACVGPLCCLDPRPSTCPKPPARCARSCACCCEADAARAARWREELAAEREDRTAFFLAAYSPSHYVFTRDRFGRLVAKRARLAHGVADAADTAAAPAGPRSPGNPTRADSSGPRPLAMR